MPRIAYKDIDLRPAALDMIEYANRLIADYRAQGFTLTLRQLYYQFIATGYTFAGKQIENTEQSYKRLGETISNGRLAGYVDWNAIEDRTRNLVTVPHWDSGAEIVDAAARSYQRDKWRGQEFYVEVWVEKDALAGVVGSVANRLDVPYFACRGYVSQSEMWVAGQRLIDAANDGRKTVIIHLGDHDPSGIDMTRDVEDRLTLFMEHEGLDPVRVERIALNMDQVRRHNPPPNPAKVTDSRAGSYIRTFGGSSWELDALNPRTLATLIDGAISEYLDIDLWEDVRAEQEEERARLQKLSNNWPAVRKMLEGIA